MDKQTLRNETRKILSEALQYSRSARASDVFSDIDCLETHVMRVVGTYASGRDYLQSIADNEEERNLARTTYFSSLHSKRRRKMIEESEDALFKLLSAEMAFSKIDHFKKFPELDGYDITSFDGHYRTHACHAPKDHNKKYRPVGGIFALNMRNGLAQSIITTDFTISKTHEIRAFKKRFGSSFTQKRRMICLADMAYWDGAFWEDAKALKSNGMYIITLMKENLSPVTELEEQFDSNHSYNIGIESVSSVTFRSGATATKIVYRDPETGNEYVYLTTLKDIEPGLIAHLYLHRWKIEKVFDVFKNKLYEQKAWADGEVSADIQASAVAMAYNILLRKQDVVLAEENIFEKKLVKKQKEAIEKRIENAKKKGRSLHPLVQIPHRFFQMSAQYIRHFRNKFHSTKPWRDLIPGFEKAMTAYL